jgi:hypothetical protein
LGPSAEEKQLLAREKHWMTGARGEEMVAEALARRCPEVPLLHDRRMPRSRANIDHIAVAASGGFRADSGLPVLRTLEINGYRLFYLRRLAKCLNSSGPLIAARARDLHAALAERFPEAQ